MFLDPYHQQWCSKDSLSFPFLFWFFLIFTFPTTPKPSFLLQVISTSTPYSILTALLFRLPPFRPKCEPTNNTFPVEDLLPASIHIHVHPVVDIGDSRRSRQQIWEAELPWTEVSGQFQAAASTFRLFEVQGIKCSPRTFSPSLPTTGSEETVHLPRSHSSACVQHQPCYHLQPSTGPKQGRARRSSVDLLPPPSLPFVSSFDLQLIPALNFVPYTTQPSYISNPPLSS